MAQALRDDGAGDERQDQRASHRLPVRAAAGPDRGENLVGGDCSAVHEREYARADISCKRKVGAGRSFSSGALISRGVRCPRMPHFSTRLVTKLAREAAGKRREPAGEAIGWAQAQAEAPLPADLPSAWEGAFRYAYALRLVKMGYAKKARRAGASGRSGTPTGLHRRLVTAPLEEFEAHDVKAKAAGVSWSTWVRRKLST